MKELSIEEKAKRFDEAIERAKKCYEESKMRGNDWFVKDIEEMFPELKESEDERIRKEIIGHVRNTRCVTEEGAERIVKWISWLEKQGNLMRALQEANKKIGELVEENYYLKEEQKGKLVLTPEAYERILKLVEKQDEQKPADKIEPKFHEGDWITIKE